LTDNHQIHPDYFNGIQEGITMLGNNGATSGLRSMVLDPHVRHILCKADDCQMKGEFENAIKLYDEVIRIQPENISALVNKANVLDYLGNHSEAIAWYNSALDIDPDNAEIWYNKGTTLKKTGNEEEALVCISNGISLAMGNCIGTLSK